MTRFTSQDDDDGIAQEVDRFFDEEDEEEEEDHDEQEDEGDRFQEKKQRIAIDIEMPSLPLPVSSDGKVVIHKGWLGSLLTQSGMGLVFPCKVTSIFGCGS